MDCAIYVRVSQEKQARQGHSLEAQEKEGKRVCKREGLNFKVFPEPGRSADKESLEGRPVLNQILELAEGGKLRYCFVTELDRLSRNPVTLAYIKKVFLDNDVKILTPNQTFDLKNDEDDFISDLLGLLAKRENRLRAKRSKRAMLESVLKGGWQGGILPFGYKRENKKLAADEEEAKIYRLMVKWSLEGKGSNTIARMLNRMNVPTKGTKTYHGNKVFKWRGSVVFALLRNPLYKGDFTYKGHKVKMPGLISEEEWQCMRDSLHKNYNNAHRNTRRFYLLRGLLHCKKCGRRLFGKIKENSHERLYCCLSKRPDPDPRFCGLRSVNLDKINNLVWENIKEMVLQPERLKEAMAYAKDHCSVDDTITDVEAKSLDKAIREKDEAIDLLLQEYGRHRVKKEYLDRNIQKLDEEKQQLLKRRDQILQKTEKIKTAAQNLKKLEDQMIRVRKRINSFTKQEKHDFLHLVINKIVVDWDPENRKHLIEIEGAIPIFDDQSLVDQLKPQTSLPAMSRPESSHPPLHLSKRCRPHWRRNTSKAGANQLEPQRRAVSG